MTELEWTPLPGGRGSLLAVNGDATAAAQRGRMTVWSGGRELAHVEASAPLDGRPRLTPESALWADAHVDLNSGEVRRLPGVQSALTAGTGLPSELGPGAAYVPAASAWSADGQALVISAAWTGPPGPPPARVVLADGTGAHRATLWEGSDVAPVAVWAGRELIAVGTREPRVFGRDGALVNLLPGSAPPVRIEADAAERRLLIAEHARVTVWATDTWQPVAEWPGPWLDAAIAPDGRTVVTVDYPGRLHVASVEHAEEPLREIAAPDPVQAVALGSDRIVAAFARGDAVRTARLANTG